MILDAYYVANMEVTFVLFSTFQAQAYFCILREWKKWRIIPWLFSLSMVV